MRTISPLSPRSRFTLTVAGVTLLLLMRLPCSAQTPGQFRAAPQPIVLPEGVDRIFALLGTNTLVAFATAEGYEHLREFIRIIDGDLDIIMTKVVVVDATEDQLKAAGFGLFPLQGTTDAEGMTGIYAIKNPISSLLIGGDGSNLIAALTAGKLYPTETLRIKTRENTPVDTLLRNDKTRRTAGGTPFTIVPREEKDGSVSLEILQPVSQQIVLRYGQTAVLEVPSIAPNTVRLLFLTADVLPRSSR